MGVIRKAFRVKNTVMHPIHAATRPVRRAVRKAVVPKSVRKASYTVRSASTAIHNPISTAVRSLDSDNWKKKGTGSRPSGQSMRGTTHGTGTVLAKAGGRREYRYNPAPSYGHGAGGYADYSGPEEEEAEAVEKDSYDPTPSAFQDTPAIITLLVFLMVAAMAFGLIVLVIKFLGSISGALPGALLFGGPLLAIAYFLSSSNRGGK